TIGGTTCADGWLCLARLGTTYALGMKVSGVRLKVGPLWVGIQSDLLSASSRSAGVALDAERRVA
ncbi:hypothetical protein, partial [Thiocapsa sp. C3-3m]|uniref:hypothetical protein n=1 Tax=Thiocapsa sp. C3-3m TaxID=3137394 RepID=UPI0035B1B06A